VVQLGYFQHVGSSNWLWGAKFSYSYLGTTSGTQNLIIPRFGTSTNPNVSTFTGFSVTQSYSVSINSQIAAILFVGRSFEEGFSLSGRRSFIVEDGRQSQQCRWLCDHQWKSYRHLRGAADLFQLRLEIWRRRHCGCYLLPDAFVVPRRELVVHRAEKPNGLHDVAFQQSGGQHPSLSVEG